MNSIAKHIEVYSQAMNLRIQRHQVLASNIANADTPDYKARDFDFAKAMQGALEGRPAPGGLELVRTSAAHLEGGGNRGPAVLQYRQEIQPSADGNTVDMDVERAQIAENGLQYQILTQLIGDRLKSLQTALASSNG